jgi:predicted small secreted protein
MKNFICLLLAVFALSACSNTFEGAGKDIEKAGQKIQETF